LTNWSPANGGNAPFAVESLGGSPLTTITELDNLEDSCVSTATLESAFSEILSRAFKRHLPTCKVRKHGTLESDSFKYSAPADDPLNDPACWPKTNPYIGVSVSEDYLRRQVENAKNIPAETNNVLRLNFCVWTQQHTRAIPMEQWRACQPMPSPAELDAALCFGCLDLGETDDFTAWGKLWTLEDGRVAVQMRYFLPSDALARFTTRPYAQWQRSGLLTVTDGPVTDYAVVRQMIREDYAACGMQTVFYDPKSARETAQILIGEGLDLVAVGQGFALDEAIKKLLALVATGALCHGGDPILAWMADNTVLRNGTKGERRLAKERAPEKIDGIAALVMGLDGAVVRREREPEPEYQVMFLGGTK
jgi:phage terminase large subunit-like protein